ncbi:hypothetical protein C2845_PM04G02050 [Panicum miliaceum]|uniref:Uncharacterized protein n=1 Tax=Panicum miliaceum TaxID=4540 RepID=A0A3L6QVB5_PANMI|nr:hypothetical protein C2845_PM04G02050 [Panicum miliaceum]
MEERSALTAGGTTGGGGALLLAPAGVAACWTDGCGGWLLATVGVGFGRPPEAGASTRGAAAAEEVQAEDMERMGIVCLCKDGSCNKLHRARPAETFTEAFDRSCLSIRG